jgi:hypothetical protein
VDFGADLDVIASSRNENFEVPVYLKAEQGYTVRRMENYKLTQYRYIDKCRYETQKQREVPVWYSGIYRSISSTGYSDKQNPALPRIEIETPSFSPYPSHCNDLTTSFPNLKYMFLNIMSSLHDVHEMNTYGAGHICLSVRLSA